MVSNSVVTRIGMRWPVYGELLNWVCLLKTPSSDLAFWMDVALLHWLVADPVSFVVECH
jgi:hypothetical protein